MLAGFKWVLLREGEDAAAAQRQRDDAGPSSRDSFYSGGSLRATAPELERLRDGLQQKEEQLASYHATIAHLEATRDRHVMRQCTPSCSIADWLSPRHAM